MPETDRISSPRVGIVLQARMGSSRLPGKVLKLLCGKPLLGWILDRLQTCRNAEMLIVATSRLERDAPVAEFAERCGADAFRGDEDDVLGRYNACADQFGLDHLVRATGDNPFVDPIEADALIAAHLIGKFDYSNSVESGLPKGVGLEVFSRGALHRSNAEGHAPHHREHVNEYILEHKDLFRTLALQAPASKVAPGLDLSVDTPEQFAWAEALYTDYFASGGTTWPMTEWLIAHSGHTIATQ